MRPCCSHMLPRNVPPFDPKGYCIMGAFQVVLTAQFTTLRWPALFSATRRTVWPLLSCNLCSKSITFCGNLCDTRMQQFHSTPRNFANSDYVQAAAVKTIHTAHHWLSEHPGFRCVCQRQTHSKLVRPLL